jgi:hypothetical protein
MDPKAKSVKSAVTKECRLQEYGNPEVKEYQVGDVVMITTSEFPGLKHMGRVMEYTGKANQGENVAKELALASKADIRAKRAESAPAGPDEVRQLRDQVKKLTEQVEKLSKK